MSISAAMQIRTCVLQAAVLRCRLMQTISVHKNVYSLLANHPQKVKWMKMYSLFHIHFIRKEFIARWKSVGLAGTLSTATFPFCNRQVNSTKKKEYARRTLYITGLNFFFRFVGMFAGFVNTIFNPSSKGWASYKYKFKLCGKIVRCSNDVLLSLCVWFFAFNTFCAWYSVFWLIVCSEQCTARKTTTKNWTEPFTY